MLLDVDGRYIYVDGRYIYEDGWYIYGRIFEGF